MSLNFSAATIINIQVCYIVIDFVVSRPSLLLYRRARRLFLRGTSLFALQFLASSLSIFTFKAGESESE